MYLLVFNMKWLSLTAKPKETEECLNELQGWLTSIRVHARSKDDTKPVPILLIGTHKDEVRSPAEHERISDLLYNTFRSTAVWRTSVEMFHTAGLRPLVSPGLPFTHSAEALGCWEC